MVFKFFDYCENKLHSFNECLAIAIPYVDDSMKNEVSKCQKRIHSN